VRICHGEREHAGERNEEEHQEKSRGRSKQRQTQWNRKVGAPATPRDLSLDQPARKFAHRRAASAPWSRTQL
jgi:hypothetical protein